MIRIIFILNMLFGTLFANELQNDIKMFTKQITIDKVDLDITGVKTQQELAKKVAQYTFHEKIFDKQLSYFEKLFLKVDLPFEKKYAYIKMGLPAGGCYR